MQNKYELFAMLAMICLPIWRPWSCQGLPYTGRHAGLGQFQSMAQPRNQRL